MSFIRDIYTELKSTAALADDEMRYGNEGYDRLRSPTPVFFKKLQKWALYGTILLSGAAVIATGVGAPAGVLIAIGAVDAMCAAALGLGQYTVESKYYDRDKRKETLKEKIARLRQAGRSRRELRREKRKNR